MANKLQLYFPQIRTRQQVLDEITAKENLHTLYNSWEEDEKQYFLDICTGVRGVKMLSFNHGHCSATSRWQHCKCRMSKNRL